MTNALMVYERMNELRVAASAMHASGFFGDVKTEAQAMVKVMAGAEIGLPPFASMTGIHIVQGKPVLGANLIATLVKNDPRYDYRVKQSDNAACILSWYESGKPVGESAFTMTEAQAAGLTGKDNWKKYPSDMLFARALTRGARRYAPGIFGGAPIYTPEEMGVDTDEEGHIIEGQTVTGTPAQQPPTPPPATNGNGGNGNGQPVDDGPLPADEQHIYDGGAKAFIADVAECLKAEVETVKARMKALGYTAVSGVPEERLKVYRALKSDLGENVQAALFGTEPEPVKFVDPA